MRKTLLISALLGAGFAHATNLVDTGTPSGIGGYALDSNDSYAGQITLAQASDITAIAAHVLGGNAGETFSVSLYSDSDNHLPDGILYAATATFGSDGWNGVSGKSWHLDAGKYWVAIEIGGGDSLSPFATLDYSAPHPLSPTAFNAGSGYASYPLSFGLRVDASVAAVPEPTSALLLIAGLSAVGLRARRRS